MRRITSILIIVFLVFMAIKIGKIKSEKYDYMKKISDGSIVSYYEKELFAGKWYSTRAKTEITIYLDGKWLMERYSGKWTVEGDNFVWIYEGESTVTDYVYGKIDKNRIVSVKDEEFILEEIDGTTTTFRRIKNE